MATKLTFSGLSAGTEMKLLYRRYAVSLWSIYSCLGLSALELGFCFRFLLAYEEFNRKMGESHMFEGTKGNRRPAVGRNVLPPKEREAQHAAAAEKVSASA